jgi:anti-sigma B factor antagonist
MPETPLVVQTIKDVTVVSFGGTTLLDGPTIETLSRRLFEMVDQQAVRKLLLDFTPVKFLSSTMLGVLVKLQKKSQAIKGRVAICGLRPDLHKVFKITRLENLFDFYPAEEEAMVSFGAFKP